VADFMKDGRIHLRKKAMPADKDGKHIVPAAWNRNDGFSPGQTILTHVRGMDNERAFNRTNPVQLEDLSRYTKRRAPIVVINAKTGERHPIWAELDPHPNRRRDVNLQIRPAVDWDEGRATSSSCAGCAMRTARSSRRVRPSGSTATARRPKTS
jgi:hypothetical protein